MDSLQIVSCVIGAGVLLASFGVFKEHHKIPTVVAASAVAPMVPVAAPLDPSKQCLTQWANYKPQYDVKIGCTIISGKKRVQTYIGVLGQ